MSGNHPPQLQCLTCGHAEDEHISGPVSVQTEFDDEGGMHVRATLDEGACLHLVLENDRYRDCTCRRFVADFERGLV